MCTMSIFCKLYFLSLGAVLHVQHHQKFPTGPRIVRPGSGNLPWTSRSSMCITVGNERGKALQPRYIVYS